MIMYNTLKNLLFNSSEMTKIVNLTTVIGGFQLSILSVSVFSTALGCYNLRGAWRKATNDF